MLKSRILQLVAATLLLACVGQVHAQQHPATAMDRDLLEVTIPQLHRYYEQQKYTVPQVVDWYLGRIARYNGIYRPIEQRFDAEARALAAREDAEGTAARGPLWGVPIVIKANTSIQGKVTTDGWEGYVVPGHELVAPRDATIVARLRAAGAIILGHTNMPDFANSDTNRSSSFGRTGNAYDVRFSPGGSSGGTVTAVTANLAVLGNGTDTGNSIRMPAATSALIGVFPTRGLVSIAGIAPLDWLLDNTGPIARNVTDAAIALGVMAARIRWIRLTQGSAAKAQPGPYTALPEERTRSRVSASVCPHLSRRASEFHFTACRRSVSQLAAARQTAERAWRSIRARVPPSCAPRGTAGALGATVVMEDSTAGELCLQVAARVST